MSLLLGVHLVADAAVDDHPAPLRLDQQRPHRQLDAVAIVGRRLLLPQRPRHDAEHRAAVEPEGAVVKRSSAARSPERQSRCGVEVARRRGAACFSSTSTPCAADGWMNATSAPSAPGPRLLVDEPHAARLQVRERRADVLDAQRDVMDARDRASRRYLAIAESGAVASSSSSADCPAGMKCARTRWLAHLLGGLDSQAERVAIERQRLVEVLHRDADVIERLHGRALSWLRARPASRVAWAPPIRIELARRDAVDERDRTRRPAAIRSTSLHQLLRQQLAQPDSCRSLRRRGRGGARRVLAERPIAAHSSSMPSPVVASVFRIGGRHSPAPNVLQRQVRRDRLHQRGRRPRDRPC